MVLSDDFPPHESINFITWNADMDNHYTLSGVNCLVCNTQLIDDKKDNILGFYCPNCDIFKSCESLIKDCDFIINEFENK